MRFKITPFSAFGSLNIRWIFLQNIVKRNLLFTLNLDNIKILPSNHVFWRKLQLISFWPIIRLNFPPFIPSFEIKTILVTSFGFLRKQIRVPAFQERVFFIEEMFTVVNVKFTIIWSLPPCYWRKDLSYSKSRDSLDNFNQIEWWIPIVILFRKLNKSLVDLWWISIVPIIVRIA